LRKTEAEDRAVSASLAYKMPDIGPFASKLNQYYPRMRIVVVKRNPIDTINSLMEKDWYSNTSLASNRIWPYRVREGISVPFWVNRDDDNEWVRMTEMDRCAYAYVRAYECVESISNKIEVSYDSLIQNPYASAYDLAQSLKVKFGDLTQDILAEIKPPIKSRDFDMRKKISPYLLSLVERYSC